MALLVLRRRPPPHFLLGRDTLNRIHIVPVKQVLAVEELAALV